MAQIKELDVAPWETDKDKVVNVDAAPWEPSGQPLGQKKWNNQFPTGETPISVQKPSDVPSPNVVRQREGILTTADYNDKGPDDPENKAKYEATGQPFTVFGIPILDWRIQKSANAEGEPRNEFVPKAVKKHDTGAYYNPLELVDAISGANGSGIRALQGGTLDAISSTVNFMSEMLAGPDMSRIEDGKEKGIGNNPISQAIRDVNKSFQEWLPGMPAENNTEKLAQEMISMVVGMAGGAKVGNELIKQAKISPKYIELLTQFYKKAINKTADPVKARIMLEASVKSMLIEASSNAGASVTMSEDAESLTGGFVKNIPGINGETANRVGAFVDNSIFSGVLGAVGAAFKLGKVGFDKIFKLDAASKKEVAWKLLSAIDSSVTADLPAEEIAKRTAILDGLIDKYKELNIKIGDIEQNIALDSNSAMMRGAMEYMQEVYKTDMLAFPPEVADEILKKRAIDMVQNLASLRQAYKNQMAGKDAATATGFKTALDSIADSTTMNTTAKTLGEEAAKGIAPPQVVSSAINRAGDPIITQLNAKPPVDLATKMAEKKMADFNADNTLMQMLREAKANGKLGSTLEEREYFNNIIEKELPAILKRDSAEVQAKFDAIPDHPVSPMAIARAIKEAGDQQGLMRMLGIAPGEAKMVEQVGDDIYGPKGELIKSPVAELAKKIEEAGINTVSALVNKVRPQIAMSRDAVKSSQNILNKDTVQFDSLLKFIDSTAKEAGDEYSIAMDAYKRYADKWLNTEPLANYVAKAKSVNNVTTEGNDWLPIETFSKGGPDAAQAGQMAFVMSRDALTPQYMDKFLDIIASGKGQQDVAFAHAVIGQAIRQIADNPTINPSTIIAGVQPYLNTLQQIKAKGGAAGTEAGVAIKRFEDTTDEMRLLSEGIETAKADDAKKLADFNESMAFAKNSKLRQFMYEHSDGTYSMVDDSELAQNFEKLFDSPNAISTVRDVLSEGKNDPVLLDAVKGEFIRYLTNKSFGRKAIGQIAQEGTTQAVRDLSPTGLEQILSGGSDTTLALLGELFLREDAFAITQLLQTMDVFINGRSARANPFGSNTVNDAEVARGVQTFLTMTLGVLNPTATKAKNVANIFTRDYKENAGKAIVATLVSMMENPNILKEALQILKADRTGATLDKFIRTNIFGGPTNSALLKSLISGGFRQQKSEQPIDQQTQEALPVPETPSTDQQTEDALQLFRQGIGTQQ